MPLPEQLLEHGLTTLFLHRRHGLPQHLPPTIERELIQRGWIRPLEVSELENDGDRIPRGFVVTAAGQAVLLRSRDREGATARTA